MKVLSSIIGTAFLAATTVVVADPEQYEVDEAHTFVTFEVSHIGFAWMPGQFNEVSGSFSFDPDDRSNSNAEFTIQTESIDTNHAKRDKHLRSDDFFHVSEYPEATFESTSYESTGEDTAVMTGDLTIKGVTREVEFDVRELRGAMDPWDNFRRAFSASTEINMDDFNVDQSGLPPESKNVELRIAVEGIRQ